MSIAPLDPPARVLMGPGPSTVPPSVLAAMAKPTVGHLDPFFLGVMDQVRDMLRLALGTTNALTLPISATGSAGMEACLVNLVEPGDRVLVGVNGVFGGRMAEIVRRLGGIPVRVERPAGQAFTVDDFQAAAAGKGARALCLVHAETSTGVYQDLRGFRALADNLGALLVVDCVTSLAGMPVELDAMGVDAAYSGTQKCLSAPPGLSPVSFSARAMERVAARTQPMPSWYLDLSLVQTYWGAQRAYHHTAPVNTVYALHEALRLALAEGLPERFARHARLGAALAQGLQQMGLVLPVDPAIRLPQLTVVEIPAGIDDGAVRRALLQRFNLEIGGGLGAHKGKVWRIGLMGAACTEANVVLCLGALDAALRDQGWMP